MRIIAPSSSNLTSQALLTRVKRIADATDRVFVSLAEGVGRLGPWQRGRSSPPPRVASLGNERSSRRASGSCGPPDGDCECARRSAAVSTFASDTPGPAGVIPVLEALDRVMNAHADQGYASLAEDERFWGLIRLLRALADGDGTLELAQATRFDEGGLEIDVEEDLSELRSENALNDQYDKRTGQRERSR